MRIVAYCRVSTEKEEQLESFEHQKQYFQDFAKLNGYELVRIYADEGISGLKLSKRKEFQKMMSDAEKGFFDKVLVKDLARFGRNTVDLLNSVRKLNSLGIDLEFTNTGMKGRDSEFIIGIHAMLAQEESASISKRVKFGKNITAKKGRVPNIVYGYNQINNLTLEIHSDESRIVRRIFNLYVNERLGMLKIAMTLNSEGVPTKRGTKWSQVAISGILRNELYIGKVVNKKTEVQDFLTGKRIDIPKDQWIVVERPEFRIVSDEVFNKAQEILNVRFDEFSLTRKRNSNAHILSTLIKCECCGFSFRRTVKKYPKTTSTWWSCSGRNKYGTASCSNKTKIVEKDFLESIAEYFRETVANREKFIEKTIKHFETVSKLEMDEGTSIGMLQKERLKLKRLKEKQIELFESDVIDIATLKEKTIAINGDIQKIDLKLLELNGDVNSRETIEKQIREVFKSIDNIISAENMTNATLKEVIEQITVSTSGEVTVKLRTLSKLNLGVENG